MKYLIVCVLLLATSLATSEEPTPENSDLQIRLLVDHSLPAPEALRKRLLTGQNIQALAAIESSNRKGGNLLNPHSVEVMWGDVALPTFVYYKNPEAALIFALPDIEIIAADRESELSMTAKLIGEEDISAGWRLPISLSDEDIHAIRDKQNTLPGRTVLIVDEETGDPISNAWVFGQRREDLLTRSNQNGRALLTAPTRNAASPHYAWADGYWTTAFDPVSSRTVSLKPTREKVDIEVSIVKPNGEGIGQAVLFVDNRFYKVIQSSTAQFEVPLNVEEPVVTVLVAGMIPQTFTLTHEKKQELQLLDREEVRENLRQQSKEGMEPPPSMKEE